MLGIKPESTTYKANARPAVLLPIFFKHRSLGNYGQWHIYCHLLGLKWNYDKGQFHLTLVARTNPRPGSLHRDLCCPAFQRPEVPDPGANFCFGCWGLFWLMCLLLSSLMISLWPLHLFSSSSWVLTLLWPLNSMTFQKLFSIDCPMKCKVFSLSVLGIQRYSFHSRDSRPCLKASIGSCLKALWVTGADLNSNGLRISGQ